MDQNNIPTWKEVAERLIKNTAIIAGQELLTKKVAPVAGEAVKKFWKKIKDSKEEKNVSPQIKAQQHQKIYKRAEVINMNDKFVVEAEFVDEVKPK